MLTINTHESEDANPLNPGNPPLSPERYPREIPKREIGAGYYIALGVCISVWMITPLSCVNLIWFVLLAQGLSAYSSLSATIFAAYALTEVVFSIYTTYLIRFVQASSPPSALSPEKRNELLRKIITADLAYERPIRPRPIPGDLDRDSERKLWEEYELGHITAAEWHHIQDREYEALHGINERFMQRRVGKMTVREREVLDAFVEESEGDRDERLRKEIERDVGQGWDDFDDEGIIGREGEIRMLHQMDQRAVEFRERLRTWFNHAPWDKIKKDNMLVWLSWSCFNMRYEDAKADKEKMEYLKTTLAMLEARSGSLFEEGFDPEVEVMRLSLDPVNARGRPLILFALSNAVNWWLRSVVYTHRGMAMYRQGAIEYLVRIPRGWTSERGHSEPKSMPVVYFHGLGFGLLQSHLLIRDLLAKMPTHPIVIPIAPHTSQSIFHERFLQPWTKDEVVDGMKGICKKWGFWDGRRTGGMSLMSHSNGSIAHSWLLKSCPGMIKRNTFVDPVCFCLWEGDICHSFCYRKPMTALEVLLYYFIATEVGIANYILRHFDWAENNLFADEISGAKDSSRMAVFLGGQDIIIDASRARRYLERHGVTGGIHWDEKGGHGDGLSGDSLGRVINFVGTGSVAG